MFSTPVRKSKMAEEFDVTCTHLGDMNFHGSVIAETATGDLLRGFNVITEALDLVKALYSPTYLSLPRSDFCNKIVEEIGDDEEVLRYTRDLLFAVTRRKRKLNPSATLVERKSGEGATDKLLKDVYEIFSYCEGGRESLPKSLLKDNSQTALDAEEFAASVQETIKTTLELSLTDVKASFAAEFQKCCDDMKATQEDLVRVAVTPSSDAEANRVQKARHPVTEVRASKNHTETVPLKKSSCSLEILSFIHSTRKG